MKVIVQDQESGIFIPFREWESIEARFGGISSYVREQTEIAVFDMSEEQLTAHLQPTAEALVKKALANGNYFSVNGSEPGQYVHEFADGSKETIAVNGQTGKSEVIKVRR